MMKLDLIGNEIDKVNYALKEMNLTRGGLNDKMA